MTTQLTLTWRRLEHAYTLDASGAGAERLANGGVYHLGGRRYRAFVRVVEGGETFVDRGSYAGAKRALERVIDRRSIGLFGVDDVAFTEAR